MAFGPLALCNRGTEEKAERGKEASIDANQFLERLDLRRPNSVAYVCFSSISIFHDSQLMEITEGGLEASGQQFIWVVRKAKHEGITNLQPLRLP